MRMRVYLTGFMGSGKSSIGRLLAQRQNLPFLDLDEEIQRTAGQTIASIFAEKGEDEFRKLERESLQQIALEDVVVATGAGCFIHNREWMLQNGTVIYLYVPFPKLAERVGADTSRPLWQNAEKLYRERENIYAEAHHRVDASAILTDVINEITSLLFPVTRRIPED